MDPATFRRRFLPQLEAARQEIGVHALEAASNANPGSSKETIMLAIVMLIMASKQVALEAGLLELHQAICAGEVPASKGGIITQ